MPISAPRFAGPGNGRGSYSGEVTNGSQTAASAGSRRSAGTQEYVMAMGQVTPPSTWASTMNLAARAAWAPARPSAHGRPISPCSAAVAISECQAGWKTASSTRSPLRS